MRLMHFLITSILTATAAELLETRGESIELAITAPLIKDAALTYHAALAKRNIQPTLREALTKRGGFLTTPLSSFGNDYGYTVSVNFASQDNKQFPLLVDTGSSRVWVFGSSPKLEESGIQRYIPGSARSVPGQTWQNAYGQSGSSGIANGLLYHDTMRVGTYQTQLNIPVAHQAKSFQGMTCSGILGLGLDDRNWKPPSNLYGINLQPDPKAHPNGGGSIQFGGTLGKYGQLKWVSVDKADRAWIVPTPAFRIGTRGNIRYYANIAARGLSIEEKNLEDHFSSRPLETRSMKRPHCALIDTGTTFTMLDDATLLTIMSAIPGSQFQRASHVWEVPCTPKTGAPDAVWFQIGRDWYSLPYKMGGLLFWDQGGGRCVASVQSRGSNECDILGAYFLHGVYAVFDEANSRIGFATKSY